MTFEIREHQITDYILGELDDEARSHVEQAMKSNPEVRNLAEKTTAFFDLLEKELLLESSPTFSKIQKGAMMDRFGMASTTKGRLKMMFENPLYHLGTRYGLVATAALVMTVALFFVMHSLIKMDSYAPDKKVEKLQQVEIVMPPEQVASKVEEAELPQKNTTEFPTALKFEGSSLGSGAQVNLTGLTPKIQITDMDFDGQLPTGPTSLNGSTSDTSAIPIVRVQPIYPREAAEQRIEGWVKMRFTISRTGTVKNPQIIASSPEKVFNDAALSAIAKWKYKPKFENGNAIETPNVQVKLTFELQDV